MNRLREKVNHLEKSCGTIVCMSDPALCEILGNAGYDYIWIDMEHTHLSYRDVLTHISTCRAAGVSSLVRVPQNDLTATKKVLEMGPDGILFPMVRSAKEVKELIDMTLYPPHGTRGFGPMRAIGYGAESATEYTDCKSLELCRFVQIEHIDCVEHLEEIVNVPFLDGFIFGPNDLSGSLGMIGRVTDPAVTREVERAVEILKKHNKYFGFAVGYSQEIIRHWASFEPHTLTTGADWNFVYDLGVQNLNNLRRLHLKK